MVLRARQNQRDVRAGLTCAVASSQCLQTLGLFPVLSSSLHIWVKVSAYLSSRFFFYFFISVLLKRNLYTIKCTYFKCIMWLVLTTVISEYFSHPPKLSSSPLQSAPTSGNRWFAHFPCSFAFSRISDKWNHTESVFLCLASFTWER